MKIFPLENSSFQGKHCANKKLSREYSFHRGALKDKHQKLGFIKILLLQFLNFSSFPFFLIRSFAIFVEPANI